MRKRIIIISVAFCVSFIIMIALSIVSMNRFVKYAYYSNFSDTSGIIIDNIYQAELHLRDIDRSERGYMLTKDTMYKRYVLNAIDSINNDIVDIDLLIDDNPKQQKNIEILKDSIALRIDAVRRNIQYVDTTTQPTLSNYFYESRNLMRACNRRLKVIHNEERKILKDRQNSEHIYEALTSSTLSYILIIFCLVTVVLFVVMIKELKSRIQFQEELQAKIFDLKRSHIELEEIAYAASHDLQEPLRKIQIFSNMLLFQKNNQIDAETTETLQRINTAANRMHLLVTDLLSLTSLTKVDENKNSVDLNRIIQYLLIDFDERIKDKNAVIKVEPLPVILGYENQIKLLFNALLDNALKFAKVGEPPVININSQITDGTELEANHPNLKNKKFIKITFMDYGIGFDNQFMNKMFRLFQQLHIQQSEYKGKGIGLAICQRIIVNHEGYILAEGKAGESAMFKIFFPVE